MDDKTLLELAAKAAGYKITKVAMLGEGFWHALIEEQIEVWSPLHNDGDALRLAVKLNIHILRYESMTTAKQLFADWGCDERDDGNSAKATRRAIVRAAAAIGESM